jgi:hypothetical protein
MRTSSGNFLLSRNSSPAGAAKLRKDGLRPLDTARQEPYN